MPCICRVCPKYSLCFFTQNVLQFIRRGKCVYFLLQSTSMWTDKTVTRRLLFFSFATGKHKAACYQVKQDKLKKILRWLSHWKPHSETVFCTGQTHTLWLTDTHSGHHHKQLDRSVRSNTEVCQTGDETVNQISTIQMSNRGGFCSYWQGTLVTFCLLETDNLDHFSILK